MSDWTDPKTWKDVRKFNAALAGLRKRVDSTADVAVFRELIAVQQGHQQSLAEMSEVAGRLVTYTTAAHAQTQQALDALAEALKAVKQLTKDVHKLGQRVEKLEAKLQRQEEARRKVQGRGR